MLTRKDISPTDGVDLDERMALEHFFGKSREEALELLRQDFSYYVEDLTYMGDKAFFYYLGAVKDYLEEGAFSPSDYVDMARELLGVFQYRESLIPNDDILWIGEHIATRLEEIVRHDESWADEPFLISEKKIRNLTKRWREGTATARP